jgi:hypothetical protein
MTMSEVLNKYGKVTASFVDGKVQGTVNGYALEIDKFEYGYTVFLFVNGGIRKFFERIEQVDSFLFDLR